MRLEALPLDGAYLLVPEPLVDERGAFTRIFSQDTFEAHGLATEFPEWSLSYNRFAGTLRGMHWQAEPHEEVKLVRVVRGEIFDVIVDLRGGSPTYGSWTGTVLTAANRVAVYCPKGFAHGFQSLTDDSEVLYHISERYQPAAARGVRWDDPDIGIDWPQTAKRVLSKRDATLPLLADAIVARWS